MVAMSALLAALPACGASKGVAPAAPAGSGSTAVAPSGTSGSPTGTAPAGGPQSTDGPPGTAVSDRRYGSVGGLAVGPDGNVWAIKPPSSIERITPAGETTRFTGPEIDEPIGITAGPDGALWFTNANDSIGRITTDGQLSKFTSPKISDPAMITTGSDGGLWFTNRSGGPKGKGSIGRISISPTVEVTNVYEGFADFPSYPIDLLDGIKAPLGITRGSDGAIWFTNEGDATDPGSIGRIAPSGELTIHSDPTIGVPTSITSGPDGRLWFTNLFGGPDGLGSVGAITVDGHVSNYANPAIRRPNAITAGPSGELLVASLGPVSGAALKASMEDFTLLPPDIDPVLMDKGPGPSPMLDTANAWDQLARELQPAVDKVTTDGAQAR
jgi:virginiamycin B lyase